MATITARTGVDLVGGVAVDDWNWQSVGGVASADTVDIGFYIELPGGPDSWGFVYHRFDTSAIPAYATVTSATLYWYQDYYTKHKDTGYVRRILGWRESTSAYTSQILYSTAIPSNGWNSKVFNAANITDMNDFGVGPDGYCEFRYAVGSLPADSNYSRSWGIRSWDYASGDTYAPYVVVNYTGGTVATARRRIFIIS